MTTMMTPPRARRSGEYADVPDMFRELERLAPDSPQYRRQRDRITERCLPLAEHIARRFDGRGEPHEDLLQVARLGLVNAVNRYDVGNGSDFLSFAVPTIMGEVRRHFRDFGWSLSVPRRLKELHLRIGVTTAEMSQRLGRAPTPSELAAELELPREQVIEGLVAGTSYNASSIFNNGGDDDDMPGIADRIGGPDVRLDHVENRQALLPLLESLPERERRILVLRFFEQQTQSQIAAQIGVSQMHVSRLLARALSRLRDRMEVR
ncbi:SigB/SigF/SigG family RNA polymerase sigma factor [Mycobacterium sp. MYCO198283]|uniref:SigB/SigF/SigG family RNA polymerase sigma factor n=1 Tax=Mycobacterium sp. MYCO198283 TaxID=2883505 RepID=UPI001E491E03|nr:SigB/SigF/SigG family RNA polymerase sigma factor [Mycobacterium sp. MYCO198283]MCG5434433.1 SigB/SigF/SigG family RNA polymerase sigma factor [Mycobacterium sp. MYCO198283]